MSVCEDAPCCGCCGPAVWAAEDQAAQEYALELRDHGPDDELELCDFCESLVVPGMACVDCDHVNGEEVGD